MPKRLKDLLIDRVDLVDKGDNPGASIALFKRNGNNKGGEESVGDDIFLSASNTGVEKLFNMFKGIFTKEGVKDNMPFDVKKFIGESGDKDLQQRVDQLSEEQVKTINENLGSLSEDARTELAVVYELDKLEKDAEIQSLKDQLEASKAEGGNNNNNNNNNNDDDDDDDDEEENRRNFQNRVPENVLKGLPEDVRKMVEDSQKEAQEAISMVRKLEEQKLIGEYVTKAKDFDKVIGEPDKVGAILKSIADKSEDDYKVIEAVLKAANERITRNDKIMQELGAGGDEGTAGDAWSKIEAQAKELVKNSPDLTIEQAIQKVMKDDPSLYKEYQKELQGEVQ